ncbi:protein of unknown function [Pseudomonas pohangensis]|uniref:DUF4124 domain-containing protein n=1 Tax=Pseudomonas pohangensis TaxID=364197 RepID=A0A1H2ETM9_9PSED|nr:DUF4124 domain-containing protein [Pseudomonas pohangensis]SDT98068.1 protein of unknown function [Pseudomonas pohangensis]
MSFRVVITVALLFSPLAQGQAFKCVTPDGQTIFSQVPCPVEVGTTTELRLPTGSVSRSGAGPSLPPAQTDNQLERLQVAADWVMNRYPFFDGESPSANGQAITEVLALRDSEIERGGDPAEALLNAAKLVGPRYEATEAIRRYDAAASIKQSSSPRSSMKVTIVEDSSRSEAGYRERIEKQLESLPSETAERFRLAPQNADTLQRAKEAASQADRGNAGDALRLSNSAAKNSAEGRSYLEGKRAAEDAVFTKKRLEKQPDAIDLKTGQVLPNVGGGVIDPRTGKFYPDAGAGYVDPETGRFMPKQ